MNAKIGKRLVLAALLRVLLAGAAAWSQANATITNQTYTFNPNQTGAGPHCLQIATLDPNNEGDYDHLHIMVTVNGNWSATANASLDALFSNRNGFAYLYTARGAQVSTAARLVGYLNSDTSVTLYLMFTDSYVTASYTVLENMLETVYASPADLGAATPPGTLVFDSSSPAYPPATFAAFGRNVGIGTTTPAATLDVNGTGHVSGALASGSVTASTSSTEVLDVSATDPNIKLYRWSGSGSLYFPWYITTGLLYGSDFSIQTGTTSAIGAETVAPVFEILQSGNVGLGTTSPGARLEVNGNVKLTAGSGGSMTFADGTSQTTAWTGVLCGGDYAESVDADGDRKRYGPGDVLVIAAESASDVERSAEPYSTLVAGVFATKPGVVGRRQATPKSPDEVPMAMVGIVPTKVSAENGPVRKGDLLVTSSTPGYAMKGTDRGRMLGAVIGKAMGSLDSGTGVIEVLVTLQ